MNDPPTTDRSTRNECRCWPLGAWERGGAPAGQGLVEYGLILALTAGLTVLWLAVFGGAISDALTVIGHAIDEATGG